MSQPDRENRPVAVSRKPYQELPYPPGEAPSSRRLRGNYTPYQEVLWRCMSEAYHARAFGRQGGLHPSPCVPVDMEAYTAWKEKLTKAFRSEADSFASGDYAPEPLTADDFQENVLLWWWQTGRVARRWQDPNHVRYASGFY